MAKGMAINTIGMYLLALIVLIIILTTFIIGPSALFKKVQSVVPKLSDFINPDRHGTSGATDGEVRQISQDSLLEIARAMKDMRDDPSDVCFHKISSENIDVLFSKYALDFKQVGDVMQLSIYDKEWVDEEDYDQINSVATLEAIDGVKPCLILGDDVVEQFYNWWFKLETINGVPHTVGGQGKPPRDVLVTQGYLIKDHEIRYDNNKYAWKTRDDMDYVIYKKRLSSSESCMAIFPVQTNWFSGSSCEREGDQLNDDCFAEGKGFYQTATSYTFNQYWYDPEHGCTTNQPTG